MSLKSRFVGYAIAKGAAKKDSNGKLIFDTEKMKEVSAEYGKKIANWAGKAAKNTVKKAGKAVKKAVKKSKK